jgi:hypothetical protein
MVEGGEFVCYKDGYKTDNIEEWNEHCSTIEDDGSGNTHIIDEGTTSCIVCGDLIEFQIPFRPKKADGSKDIQLRCNECEEAATKGVKVKKI